MELVAVIDLMDGRVVRARGGMRGCYRPVESQLCGGADGVSIVAALLRVHPFRIMYVADLDAILGRGGNRGVLRRIRHRFPDLTIWLDAGADNQAGIDALAGLALPVLGSESLRDCSLLAPAAAPVLSLDFRGGRFLGPPELLDATGSWPQRVIVMNLDRVGNAAGPDIELMQSLRARAPDKAFYLAGGVRNRADLEATRQAGAAGVLLASALHDGSLSAAELADWAARPEASWS